MINESEQPILIWDMDALKWMDSANCRGLPVDYFYYTAEDTDRNKRHKKERAALKVCNNCSVKQQCLEDAIRRNDAHSIQGGTTPRMRGHIAWIVEDDLPVVVVQSPDKARKVVAHVQKQETKVNN